MLTKTSVLKSMEKHDRSVLLYELLKWQISMIRTSYLGKCVFTKIQYILYVNKEMNYCWTTSLMFNLNKCCDKSVHGQSVLCAGHFKGKTWLPPLSRAGMWHWQSVSTAASSLPACKGAHASVHLSANWWLARCVFACYQLWPKGLFWGE